MSGRQMLVLESSSFHPGVLPWTPCLFNELYMVNLWTEVLASSNDVVKPLAVTRVFVFASLRILRSASGAILAGHRPLGGEAKALNRLLWTICPFVAYADQLLLIVLLKKSPFGKEQFTSAGASCEQQTWNAWVTFIQTTPLNALQTALALAEVISLQVHFFHHHHT